VEQKNSPGNSNVITRRLNTI